MKKIKLTKGKYSIVDDVDYKMLIKYKWHFSGRYAQCNINGITTGMHRLIMQTPKGMDTDHINREKLDNRRCNLRICSHSENLNNRSGVYFNSSKYIGVGRQRGKWTIKYNNTQYGTFETEIEAAAAYNIIAKQINPNETILNDVEKINVSMKPRIPGRYIVKFIGNNKLMCAILSNNKLTVGGIEYKENIDIQIIDKLTTKNYCLLKKIDKITE